jgi:hypothetical protein
MISGRNSIGSKWQANEIMTRDDTKSTKKSFDMRGFSIWNIIVTIV